MGFGSSVVRTAEVEGCLCLAECSGSNGGGQCTAYRQGMFNGRQRVLECVTVLCALVGPHLTSSAGTACVSCPALARNLNLSNSLLPKFRTTQKSRGACALQGTRSERSGLHGARGSKQGSRNEDERVEGPWWRVSVRGVSGIEDRRVEIFREHLFVELQI